MVHKSTSSTPCSLPTERPPASPALRGTHPPVLALAFTLHAHSRSGTASAAHRCETVPISSERAHPLRRPHWCVTQQKVYEYAAKQTVADVINGFNGTVFAYGQVCSP